MVSVQPSFFHRSVASVLSNTVTNLSYECRTPLAMVLPFYTLLSHHVLLCIPCLVSLLAAHACQHLYTATGFVGAGPIA
jgi:hypothetical protein